MPGHSYMYFRTKDWEMQGICGFVHIMPLKYAKETWGSKIHDQNHKTEQMRELGFASWKQKLKICLQKCFRECENGWKCTSINVYVFFLLKEKLLEGHSNIGV